jgi:hypothetical protein
MEIDDLRPRQSFQMSAEARRKLGRRDHVEKLRRGVTAEEKAPSENDHATNDPDDRIEAFPAKITASEQGEDCQHACDGICENMEIRGSQVRVHMIMRSVLGFMRTVFGLVIVSLVRVMVIR